MFAVILKELRVKAGLTQGQIAEILGTQQRTYASWERNERQPDFQTLLKIADYFGVTTDYLLGRKPMDISCGEAETVSDTLSTAIDFGSSSTDLSGESRGCEQTVGESKAHGLSKTETISIGFYNSITKGTAMPSEPQASKWFNERIRAILNEELKKRGL